MPDPAASARFYARVFKTALHQQPVRDTLRYFVLLGDLPADRQVGYIAIGAAGERPTSIGHYCVLAKVYDRPGMSGALKAAGFPDIRGAGGLGMWPDPDGLELQLFQPPAGLVTAAAPSPLPVEGDGLLAPRGDQRGRRDRIRRPVPDGGGGGAGGARSVLQRPGSGPAPGTFPSQAFAVFTSRAFAITSTTGWLRTRNASRSSRFGTRVAAAVRRSELRFSGSGRGVTQV